MHLKMNWFKIFFMLILLTLRFISLITAASEEFRNQVQPTWQRLLENNPRMMDRILDRLKETRLQDSSFSVKRGLDLGLNRGISGTQAGKHLIGLTTAHFADGPGRRRRSG